MVLIGLLVVALACLVIGLVTAGSLWLVGSLVASVLAGYLLWKQREQLAARAGVHKDQAAPRTSSPAATRADPPQPPDTQQQVWVVDTQPQFHAKDCAATQNLDAEAVSLAQAVGDGFTECTVCKPTPSASLTQQVWVVDGRPDYHGSECRSLKIAASQQGRDPEQIPRGQAVDDGFSACPDCRPDGPAAAAAPPQQQARPAAPKTVWVVDGRPRYHLSDCMIIKDQQAEEIAFEQATGDGFMACAMCEPSAARV
ncbi:MAG TPA: hypothetical protein VIG48_08915 [Jatrophihabitans sp.]|jgi:hypothetical protein